MKTTMKSVLAIRHVAFEDLGAFAPVLRNEGFDIRFCDVGRDDLDAVAAEADDVVIVLGGPIGAYDEDTYPVLKTELQFLERRLESGRPLMGICLGAQLIARAAGARVYPGPDKEISFAPLTLTDVGAASCLAPFADAPMTLHWHGDTFDLPDGAERLASTALYENQAFSLGPNVAGFQFHPEADTAAIEHWLIGHAFELAASGIDIPRLRAEASQYGAELTGKAQRVMSAWLAGLKL